MEINRDFFKDTFGWGFLLWLFGYIFGIVLFMAGALSIIGWIITPIASAISIWVLIRKIKTASLQYYIVIGVIWTMLAVVLDYFLIVKAFKPEDGYYKLDVYLYYALAFTLPVIIGFRKQKAGTHGKPV